MPPQPQTEDEASAQLLAMIPFAFFLRVERGAPSGGSSSPKHLQIVQQQTFHADMHFAWFYDGPQWTTYLGGALMVAVILAGVMFPLWPPTMRLGVYYLSLVFFGLIGLFFAIAIFRLIFYIITIIAAPPGIWIFPKLFADVGFVSALPQLSRTYSYTLESRLNLLFPPGTGTCLQRRRVAKRRVKRGTRNLPMAP